MPRKQVKLICQRASSMASDLGITSRSGRSLRLLGGNPPIQPLLKVKAKCSDFLQIRCAVRSNEGPKRPLSVELQT